MTENEIDAKLADWFGDRPQTIYFYPGRDNPMTLAGEFSLSDLANIIQIVSQYSFKLEPIPERVYWSPSRCDFRKYGSGSMGGEFYLKWHTRANEFPRE